MGQSQNASGDILAQTGNPTSVAGPTIRRQFNPREEPRALTGARGSTRGVLSNGDSYRNRCAGLVWGFFCQVDSYKVCKVWIVSWVILLFWP